MRGMNKWLVGGAVFALVGAVAAGCTVEDDEPQPGLGGTSGSGGSAGETSGGTAGETSGGTAGETSGGTAGETSGGTAGETSGGAGGVTEGGAAGTPVGGAGGNTGTAGGAGGPTAGAGGEGGVTACLHDGDGAATLPTGFSTCSAWSTHEFVTQQCPGAGDDPEVNGPEADDQCWLWLPVMRAESFDALLVCMGGYERSSEDCNSAHETYMLDCVDKIAGETCTDGTEVTTCAGIVSDCAAIDASICEGDLAVLRSSVRSAAETCWSGVDKTRSDWADICQDSYNSCIFGSVEAICESVETGNDGCSAVTTCDTDVGALTDAERVDFENCWYALDPNATDWDATCSAAYSNCLP